MISCSSLRINTENDFEQTDRALKKLDLDLALASYPQNEKNGFITSYDQSWIAFWKSEPLEGKFLSTLKSHNHSFDERKYISLTKESEYFLFQETEEGYIPSEHEIISTYLLQSMAAIKANNFESARIDLKKSAEILQNRSKDSHVNFDDPSLRIWMASLWYALGEWNEALVDLRRAHELSPSPAIELLLLEPKGPKEWTLVFEGVTPLKKWTSISAWPEFLPEKSRMDSEFVTYSTHPLMLQHSQRLHLLREQITKSKYMSQFVLDESLTMSEKILTKATTYSIATTGVLTGTAIAIGGMYLLVSAGVNNGDTYAGVIGLGVLVGSSVYEWSMKFHDKQMSNIRETEAMNESQRHKYRYLRYFPQNISIQAKDTFIYGHQIEWKHPSQDRKLRMIWAL